MKCSVRGCQNDCVARRFCGKHYRRWLLYGDPSVALKVDHVTHPARRHSDKCSVAGCKGRFYAHGFCRPHHTAWKRHGDPLAVVGQFRTHLEAKKTLHDAPSIEETDASFGHMPRRADMG